MNKDTTDINYQLLMTQEILLTSEAGDKIAPQQNLSFQQGTATGKVIVVRPDIKKQKIVGIGTSFTESSAFVLAHLPKDKRAEVMENIYGEKGANFSIARTHIGATDFAVDGRYSYAERKDDANLTSFSIAVDSDGFSAQDYPGIKDEQFDLLPMIKEAYAIKNQQVDKDLKIVASAWTAPPWMKTIEDYYVKPTPENNHQGTGGELKPQYVATYADYLIKYLDAYQQEGIELWALTPVNEPHGNSGQWESMHFTPKSQNTFIKDHLGPKLKASAHKAVKLLIYDQNRDEMEHWTDEILGDKETSEYVYGTAVHWYESSNQVNEDVFDRVHEKFPEFSIIHTEGTIDDLGKDAPAGILDPVRFKESNWFNNDDFWWNENATDWAYTATWAPKPEDHPIYTPVHRYARNIIVSLDHWLEGWIDWNIVLDKHGGPNHVGNFCGAPIMIDTETGEVYYTPIYYVLAQFSKTIRPGDTALQVNQQLEGLDKDALHASAAINDNGLVSVQLLNTTKAPINYSLQIGSQYAQVTIAANAVQTVRVKL
ncbi:MULTISPECIES: glycoside hydrolase family 30 beta sandwich domain-containing protein [unclassified Colwellia]|uniref:glycoside hydrolase family 30 protein n=1 Tax=unclassified Colwellia TaxID=196834 RepID=UPI002174EE42|nr:MULTISPECIES: glycoside hydrolase family 30 beta sandwich domain-containing protein [unclassified Colwellia]